MAKGGLEVQATLGATPAQREFKSPGVEAQRVPAEVVSTPGGVVDRQPRSWSRFKSLTLLAAAVPVSIVTYLAGTSNGEAAEAAFNNRVALSGAVNPDGSGGADIYRRGNKVLTEPQHDKVTAAGRSKTYNTYDGGTLLGTSVLNPDRANKTNVANKKGGSTLRYERVKK